MPAEDVVRKRRIRSALAAVGSSQAECAQLLVVSEATVSRVVAGLQNNERVEAWIAERTGVSREELFAPQEQQASAVA